MALPEQFGFSSGYCQTNGVRLHYARTGKCVDGRVPLILLHGWPEFWLTWRKLMPLLADKFILIAPDLRGFGYSDKPAFGPSKDLTPDTLAADIFGLADALGLDRFGLVGHDVGSFVMQTMAHAAPQRIEGLFFFNCAYPGIGTRWYAHEQIPEVWYQTFNQMPWAARLVGSSREACQIYLSHFLDHWPALSNTFERDLDLWVDNFMRPGNLQGGFNWYLSINEYRKAVARGDIATPPPINLPTHALWGRHDPVLRAEWSDRMTEFFPLAKVSICEDAGHFVHYEQPEIAAQAVAKAFEPMKPVDTSDAGLDAQPDEQSRRSA